PGLFELRRLAIGKFSEELAPGADDKLRCFATRRNENSRLRIKLRNQTEQIAVQSAAQTFVRTDHNDCAFVDFTLFQQRMGKSAHSGCCFALDAIKHPHEGTPCQGSLLGLTHLRRRHHLHGFGDLRGATDGADPSPQIAWTVHTMKVLSPSLFELVSR